MNIKRYFFTMTTLGDKMLAIGGYGGVNVSEVLVIEGDTKNYGHSKVEIYDINQGFIGELPELPTPRVLFGCALFNNEVWVAGGGGADFSLTMLVEVFNLASRTWRTGPSMRYARVGLTLEVVGDELIAFGGYGYPDSLERFNGENWIFDVEPMHYHHDLHSSVVISC